MKDGFVQVIALSPTIRVADVAFNVESIAEDVVNAAQGDVRVIVLPELCVTGATCGDLFFQSTLLEAAERGVVELAERTAELDCVLIVGAPFRSGSKLYDCAFVLASGQILGIVPKTIVPAAASRFFSAGPADVVLANIPGYGEVPFGANLLFAADDLPELSIAIEFGNELAAPFQPSQDHALAGATLICCPSASPEVVDRAAKRRELVRSQSARLMCGYVLAEAPIGESSTDGVYGGQCLIAEAGELLAEAPEFSGCATISEVDVKRLAAQRRHASAFDAVASPEEAAHAVSYFTVGIEEIDLTRGVDAFPFVPDDPDERDEHCETILSIQAQALARRMSHTGSKRVVVGVSGGLDSTLAMLVCARAFDILDEPRSGIMAITMPGFGTTERTKGNAEYLAEALGAELKTIDITASVRQHFADIGHDEEDRNATYENAQARERTQILMDIANEIGGLVVGTGDLSELALGWATYNGDHMSMYSVNGGVPKTLIRHIMRYVAETCEDEALAKVLLDVLDTPVSPELLPAEADGTISQQTEGIVGPYELHDFFLYNMLRHGFGPAKILRLACEAFDGGSDDVPAYDRETILGWLKVFCRRFFAQQFKRSCLPDGPKVGSVGVSPRGGLVMPSDAMWSAWEAELEQL